FCTVALTIGSIFVEFLVFVIGIVYLSNIMNLSQLSKIWLNGTFYYDKYLIAIFGNIDAEKLRKSILWYICRNLFSITGCLVNLFFFINLTNLVSISSNICESTSA